MNDLIPDPMPEARAWKREIFEHVDALLRPARRGPSSRSAFAIAWSYRYGSWGRNRPDMAAFLDLLVLAAFLFFALELTSYSAYALKFQHWFRTTILRRPQLDVKSILWEEMIYRVQAAHEASLRHAQVYGVDPFEGLKPWEKLYGAAFVRLVVGAWKVVLSLLVIYIVWFLVKYFSFVFQALAGLFQGIFNYLVDLAIALIVKILPKWIRKLLKLPRKLPSFARVIRKWRDAYINPWIHIKVLRYFQKISILREKTIGHWKRVLVEEPVRNLQQWYQRFRKVHVDLSYLDFLRLVVALHPVYAQSPETAAFAAEHGANAALQRFFTVLSKALHWSRKRRTADEKARAAAAAAAAPRWWHYAPVAGMYLLLAALFGLSLALWIGSMGQIPVSWDALRQAAAMTGG